MTSTDTAAASADEQGCADQPYAATGRASGRGLLRAHVRATTRRGSPDDYSDPLPVYLLRHLNRPFGERVGTPPAGSTHRGPLSAIRLRWQCRSVCRPASTFTTNSLTTSIASCSTWRPTAIRPLVRTICCLHSAVARCQTARLRSASTMRGRVSGERRARCSSATAFAPSSTSSPDEPTMRPSAVNAATSCRVAVRHLARAARTRR